MDHTDVIAELRDPSPIEVAAINPAVTLTPTTAMQFAILMSSGLPPLDAIQYFIEGEPTYVAATLARWLRSPTVKRAVEQLQGKPWTGMSLEEKLRFSLDKHYTEVAYYLYSHNYSELSDKEKAKADTCREVIERRLAGTAGKTNPLEAFMSSALERVKARAGTGVSSGS